MADKQYLIVADDKIPFLRGVLEPYATVNYVAGTDTTPEIVREADVLITRTRTRCDEQLLTHSSVLLITTATIGYDHIDTQYCISKGIRWMNAPGCNATSVMQYLIAVLLLWSVQRRISLRGLTLGIIGAGNVGRRVGEAALALGMRVLMNDPPRATLEGEEEFVELDVLLAQSDIISCHTPLTYEGDHATFHLANKSFFRKTKHGVLYINTARGEITDSEALRQAYKSGQVSNYVLDVWEHEPHIDKELLYHAFVATPHIAGYSADGKAKGTAACVEQIAREWSISELQGWYPKEIPPPLVNSFLTIDCNGKSDEEVAFEAVNYTYDVEKESRELKEKTTNFEQQRSEYAIRREFPYFTLCLHNASINQQLLLQRLGFNLQSENQ